MCLSLRLKPHAKQTGTKRMLAHDFAQRIVPKPPASPSASSSNLLINRSAKLEKYVASFSSLFIMLFHSSFSFSIFSFRFSFSLLLRFPFFAFRFHFLFSSFSVLFLVLMNYKRTSSNSFKSSSNLLTGSTGLGGGGSGGAGGTGGNGGMIGGIGSQLYVFSWPMDMVMGMGLDKVFAAGGASWEEYVDPSLSSSPPSPSSLRYSFNLFLFSSFCFCINICFISPSDTNGRSSPAYVLYFFNKYYFWY